MIKTRVTPAGVVRLLNGMLKLDRKAVDDLISQRVNCNEKLAEHPTVQVGKVGNSYQVGMLGVLNGMFGIAEDGYGAIAAVFDTVCPKGHGTLGDSTNNCTVCGEKMIFGKLTRFMVIRKAGQ